jgi:hypothetical protein
MDIDYFCLQLSILMKKGAARGGGAAPGRGQHYRLAPEVTDCEEIRRLGLKKLPDDTQFNHLVSTNYHRSA